MKILPNEEKLLEEFVGKDWQEIIKDPIELETQLDLVGEQLLKIYGDIHRVSVRKHKLMRVQDLLIKELPDNQDGPRPPE